MSETQVKYLVPERISARDRLLAAADELFYAEGLNAVGIDRVIERAGVAKASLYNIFGSKEELIRAYLEAKHEARTRRTLQQLQRFATARDKLLGIFDLQAESGADPRFRGCAFVRANVELKSGSSGRAVCDRTRAWLRELLAGLAGEAGAANPRELAEQLALLYDGAATAAQMDRDNTAALRARRIAAGLIEAALAAAH